MRHRQRKEVNGKKVKGSTAKVRQEEVRAKVKEEKWQGKRICNRCMGGRAFRTRRLLCLA